MPAGRKDRPVRRERGEVRYDRAGTLLDQGRPDEAIVVLDEAEEEYGRRADVQVRRALAYGLAGAGATALVEAQSAVLRRRWRSSRTRQPAAGSGWRRTRCWPARPGWDRELLSRQLPTFGPPWAATLLACSRRAEADRDHALALDLAVWAAGVAGRLFPATLVDRETRAVATEALDHHRELATAPRSPPP